ncbi:hypothetical protein DFS34DRAFT_645930 [Phlyctochytrium arcticum]|nr:hypothetical protein DFS34DRAFT_645930 [Phlyctochytrium arcticum]
MQDALKEKQDQLRLAQRRLNHRKRENAATDGEESLAAQSVPNTDSDRVGSIILIEFETFLNNILATKCKDCSGVFDRNTGIVKTRGFGVKASLKCSCRQPKIFRNFEDARTIEQQSNQGAISCTFNKLVPAAMMHAGLGCNQLTDFLDVVGITARLTRSKIFENMGDKDALALTEENLSTKKSLAHVIERAKEPSNTSIAASYDNGWAHMRKVAESHGELIAWDYDEEEYITRPIIAMSLCEKSRGLKAVLREGNFEGPSKQMEHFNLKGCLIQCGGRSKTQACSFRSCFRSSHNFNLVWVTTSRKSHIQLTMGEDLSAQIYANMVERLSLGLVDGHGKCASDRELSPIQSKRHP